MSDVSKTNDELEKLALAAEDAAGGPPSAEQVDALIEYADALRDALEAATRVPVQREPNDEADFRLARSRGYAALKAERDFTGHMDDGRRTAYYEGFKLGRKYPQGEPNDDWEALRIAVGRVVRDVMNFPQAAQVRLLGQDMSLLRDALVDSVVDAGFSRATVPDAATEELQADRDSLEERNTQLGNQLAAVLDERDAATAELTEAIRLTVEYTGNDLLPAIVGWSWFDALKKYAPDVAQAFVDKPIRFPKIGEPDAATEAGRWYQLYEKGVEERVELRAERDELRRIIESAGRVLAGKEKNDERIQADNGRGS